MQTAADNKRKRSEADAEEEKAAVQPPAAAAAASSSEPTADGASKKKKHKKKKRLSPASVPPAVGVMLPLLQRDCAAQFHLTHFLDFDDLSALFESCRTWRDWLRSPSSNLLDSVRGQHRMLEVDCGQLQRLASSWLRSYVANLSASAGDDDTAARRFQQSRKPCGTHHALFDALPSFPRLRSLTLVIDAPIDPKRLQKCFRLLSDRLTDLSVSFSSEATGGESCGMEPRVLEVIHELHALQSLTFDGSNFYDPLVPFSFENLPRLSHLHTLKMKIMEPEPREENDEADDVYDEGSPPLREARCSLAQADCLARCPALTYLECGSWSTPPLHLDPDAGTTPDYKLPIARLVAGKVGGGQQQLQTQSSAAASSSSSSLSFAAPPAAALTYLDLGSTVMSGPLWRHIRHLSGLTKLTPCFWRAPSGLLPGDWTPLANFKNLRHFSLDSGRPWGSKQPGEGPRPPPIWAEDEDWDAEQQAEQDEAKELASRDIATEDFLPHLLTACGPVLQSLKLSGGGFTIDEEQMGQIARGFTQLRSLLLQEVQLESVQPLVHATELRTLKLVECINWEGEQEQYRTTLPSMPQLTSLALFDITPLRRAEAEQLNDALLQRMPNLDAEDFFPKTFKD